MFFLIFDLLTCFSFPVLPNVCLMPVCRMLDSPSMLKRYAHTDRGRIITNYKCSFVIRLKDWLYKYNGDPSTDFYTALLSETFIHCVYCI